MLAGLALVNLAAWPNLLNFHYSDFVHRWEFFHYYMGGKYLPELGYTKLYACTAVVDAEDIYDVSCDIFSPCALGASINDETILKSWLRDGTKLVSIQTSEKG